MNWILHMYMHWNYYLHMHQSKYVIHWIIHAYNIIESEKIGIEELGFCSNPCTCTMQATSHQARSLRWPNSSPMLSRAENQSWSHGSRPNTQTRRPEGVATHEIVNQNGLQPCPVTPDDLQSSPTNFCLKIRFFFNYNPISRVLQWISSFFQISVHPHGHHDSNRVLNNTPTNARSARFGVLLRRHTPSTR